VPLLLLIVVAVACAALAAMLAAQYPTGVVEEAVEESTALRRWLRARRDPQVLTGLALTLAFGLVIGGGLLLALLAALVRSNDTLLDADAGIARWGNANAGHLSTRGLELVTQLGEAHTVLVLGVVLAVVETIRTRTAAVIGFLLVVTLGDSLVTNGVKELVNRARPTLNPIAHTLGPSFPSGHSSTAAAFYAAAALLLARRRSRRVRIALAATAVGIAVAVGASRVLLDVHWTSDVIAGLALGFGWFALCTIAFGGRLLRFGAPAEKAARVEAARAGDHEADEHHDDRRFVHRT
jgi:membrane-associated phospholipid phosphatase